MSIGGFDLHQGASKMMSNEEKRRANFPDGEISGYPKGESRGWL
jgi:hypothetical protein